MSALIGTLAPDFKLQNENEEWMTRKELNSRGPLMIVFYPGDFHTVCTKQLCAYQEAHDRFVDYGIQVVGISPNAPEEHQRFKSRYLFAFHLLSDPKKEVFKLYGVTSFFMLGGISRAVLIVAKNGTVLYRFVEPTVLSRRDPEELLIALDQLRSKGLIG